TPQRDIFSWDIVFYARREGTLTDYQGNFLRVTQHGPNWGTPYTAKPSYLEKDTTNSPKSNFIFPHDMERWNRYVNGNLGDTLAHCPAPGKKENIAKTRVKRSLPPDFTFTDAWINRLWQIAISSTPAGLEGIGICGPCMVQTLQMLVELQERYQREPLQDGNGYFFNTQAGVDLFPSLRARFPELTQRLDTIRFNHDIPYHVGEDFMTRMSRLGRAVALTMLPQYEWRPLTLARNQEEMLSRIRDILYAPVGTLWFSVAIRQGERGLFLGHAQPIIRTGNGVIVLPTNTYGTTFEQFSRYFTPITDPNIVLHELSQSSSSRIQTQSIAFFQMAHLNEIPLSLYVSQRNCTGEGDDRRGNKEFPRSSLINQCGSGRCAIQ
ncbi:DUF1561 family protein, partial [Bartonella bacilliformis]